MVHQEQKLLEKQSMNTPKKHLMKAWPYPRLRKEKMADVQIEDKGISPVPYTYKPQVEMAFPDAIREILNGNHVTRLSWNDKDSYGLLKDGFLSIKVNGGFHQWLVNDGDMEGNDWVVLPKGE